MLEELHYCMHSIFYVPREIHHRICPILTYARRIALLHVPDIACARRNASLHCARYCMCPKKCIIACARYYMCSKKCIIALCPRLHCARSPHKPKIESCSMFTCARIKSSHKYQQMSKTDTLSLLIIYIPKASSSKGVIFHGLHTFSWPEDLFYAYHVPKAS